MKTRRKRPWLVTSLSLAVLSITTIHLVRFVQALTAWDFLSSLPGISPGYLAATGLAGALAGLSLFWGLWQGRRWAPAAARSLATLYTIYWWLEELLTAKSTESLVNWPFNAFLSAFLLLLFFLPTFLPGVKAYFGAPNERSE
jgi:hypothetical protein